MRGYKGLSKSLNRAGRELARTWDVDHWRSFVPVLELLELDGWTWHGEQLARHGWHYYAGLPPLPKGRRLRRAEHGRRWKTIVAARNELQWILRRRFAEQARLTLQIAKLDSPRPKHGPRCGPDCADCAAIRRWREQLAKMIGVPQSAFEGLV